MPKTFRRVAVIGVIVAALGVGAYAFRHRLGGIAYIGRRSEVPTLPMAAPSSMPAASSNPPGGKSQENTGTARGEVTIDPRRQQLIGVRTVEAKREVMAPSIRAVGMVRYDERRLAEVNLKLEGWIRDLYVNVTGQPIAKGQPLFTLYSPDLLNTENEYLLAITTRDQMQQSMIPDARERADHLVAAARQRLTLWDLPAEEIRALEERHQAHDAMVFRSPVTGFVLEKQVLTGMHVMPGQTLYKIADLSVVWIEADLYESELPLVRISQRATVTLDAYPDERFSGRVIYIYPYVDEKTRTNKVRYEFANREGRIKPGMYANVEIAGSAESAIVVPMNAVLDSGKEQVVFVAKGDGYFEPRRVKIGRRFDDRIQIVDGIKEGEQIATGATFLLDSESQLRASLQSFEAPQGQTGGVEVRQQLDITLRSNPDPPKTGENQWEVVVKDAAGKPIDDAEVTVQFFMAAMPTMNMPAMRNEVKLSPAGGGLYRGTGQVMMAGRWDTTVTVMRGGQRIGAKQLAIATR